MPLLGSAPADLRLRELEGREPAPALERRDSMGSRGIGGSSGGCAAALPLPPLPAPSLTAAPAMAAAPEPAPDAATSGLSCEAAAVLVSPFSSRN